jgi:exodeoxyribonuclease VII small subunit
MGEETYNFTQARARLEEIVTQVRKKDTSLEQSLDMLEEGVRLANACTELIDHTEWRAAAAENDVTEADEEAASGEDADLETAAESPEADDTVDVVVVEEEVIVVVEAVEDSTDFGEADDAWADEDAASDEG